MRAADAALYTLLQAEALALALSRPASHTQTIDKNKTQKATKGASGISGPGSTGTRPESGYGTGMFLEPQRVDEELWITVTESIVDILGDFCTVRLTLYLISILILILSTSPTLSHTLNASSIDLIFDPLAESRSEYQEALQIAFKAANYETANRSTHTGYNTGSSNSTGSGIGSGIGSGGDAVGHVGEWKDIQSTISGPYIR